MSVRERLRPLAAAVRSTLLGPPLLRLLRLLRRGETSGREYADLCLQLGLGSRATAALSVSPVAATAPSLPIRLAALAGSVDAVISRSRALTAQISYDAVPQRELEAAVSTTMPLAPETALALIRASGRPHPAEPALLLRLGDVEGCLSHLDRQGAQLGPQRWLLWANLHNEPAHQLEGLNRFLAEHGLAPARLRNIASPLSVSNLDGARLSALEDDTEVLLSVVMTCYDCAAYVDAAIRSVLHQTHRHLELIAVDDGSRDDTWHRLQALAADDSRLRPVRQQRNVGTYAAKNVGLALARGAFLAFQDADDWSCPERFALCLDLLRRRPWVQAVVCEYVRLQDDGRFWSNLIWPLQRRTPNSVLFRRRAFERIGYFDEHRFGADGEFVARLQVAFGPRALHRLARPLIVAARRQNSLMTAPSTGLDPLGRSQARADYQEAWTEELLRRALTGASLYRPAQLGTPAAIAHA